MTPPDLAAVERENEASLKLVTLYPHNYRDVVATLRFIASKIEEGEGGEIRTAALVILNEEGAQVYGMGPEETPGSMVIAFHAGINFLVQAETGP